MIAFIYQLTISIITTIITIIIIMSALPSIDENGSISLGSYRPQPKKRGRGVDDEQMSQSIYESMTCATSVHSSSDDKAAAFLTLRSNYEALIAQHAGSDAWKSAFYLAAKKLVSLNENKRRVVVAASAAASAADTITFASSETGDLVHTINRASNPVVFAGRLGNCELHYSNKDRCTSRCHLIIFCNPGEDIMVVDMGSTNGYEIMSTTSNNGLKNNTNGITRDVVTVFPRDESVLLRWGKQRTPGQPAEWNTLTINPGVCTICMDNARSVRYASCKHLSTCGDCHSKRVAMATDESVERECEICRARVTTVTRDFNVHSMA